MDMETQTTLTPNVDESEAFFRAINKDIIKNPIQFLSERGHGKSSTLKTIVKRCREARTDVVFYIFDPSTTWYESAPVKYRQFVTVDRINAGQTVNVGDCVYEIGSLTEAQRRTFVGSMIAQHYKARYEMKINNPAEFAKLPTIVYVIEESNCIFGSFSFRIRDWISPILSDFISIGRNYKLSAIMVATAEEGEMAPSLRRRTRRIYGRLVAEGDVARVRRKDKAMANYLSKEIPRFHFVYDGDRFFGPIKVPDEVKLPAEDFPLPEATPQRVSNSSCLGWFMVGFIGVLGIYMLLKYFYLI